MSRQYRLNLLIFNFDRKLKILILLNSKKKKNLPPISIYKRKLSDVTKNRFQIRNKLYEMSLYAQIVHAFA